MLSKGTNIVLLCAIWTNITVSISSVPAISIFCSLYDGRSIWSTLFYPGVYAPCVHMAKCCLGKVSAPVCRGESLGSVLVPGQLRTTCEHKYSL